GGGGGGGGGGGSGHSAANFRIKTKVIDTLEFGGQSFITGVQEHQTRLLKLLGVLYEAVYS
ncbi:hypothetical protein K6U49_22130, partial [Vibrio alginolyticus]|uniref:hypothetical protein n=1 Tax=Vibrio alginolyticus TaxID=663 RepID=UPI001EE9CAD6